MAVCISLANTHVTSGASPAPAILHPTWNQTAERPLDGFLLLHELNCTACHAGAIPGLPTNRQAPNLAAVGSRVSPQWLRAFLASPHTEKPGTPMPDLLHAIHPEERSATLEALVHFLVSLAQTPAPEARTSNPFKMAEGRALFHKVGCVACHAPQDPPNLSTAASNPSTLSSLETQSIPLGNLPKKYTVGGLATFLLDPLAVRPSGRMPSLKLSEFEAHAIALYLLRQQTNAAPGQPSKVQGLYYEYFEAEMNQTAPMDNLSPVDSGNIERFSLSPQKRNDNIAFRYTGLLSIPQDGTYEFFLSSDDGSVLFLGDRKLVENDGIHGTTEQRGRINLKAGDHPIMVLWFNAGGGAELKVEYEGPDLPRQEIPAQALSFLGQAMVPLEHEALTPDPAKVRQGRKAFASLGCAACHETGQPDLKPVLAKPPPALASLPQSNQGCLSPTPPSGTPRFALSDIQRAALRNALDNAITPPPASSAEQIHRALTSFNCYACHSRESHGGPTSARAEYFALQTAEDLGDEGRIPPHLSGVGSKLHPEWLREVLTKQGVVRPYMATRMPQFGDTHVAPLVELFLQADHAGQIPADEPVATTDIKYGRALVGSGGLSCISCHVFGNYPSLGIQAMDMTQMAKRIRQDWFRRYLLDPQSLRPGTRMPSFWPEGVSMRKDLLQGNTARQIDAIWAYLNLTSEAGLPPGLIQGQMEIVADSHAVVYRAFLNQSGTRGIGVAYPEKANLTFDASQLRPALIWQGPFLDAAQHRIGRGAGFQGPLGYNVVAMPEGPPLAILEDFDVDWPAATGREAGYRMHGYQLDARRRPAFQYDFQGVRVEDFPVAVPGDLEASFRRTLTFRSDQPVPNLWFRAWRGDSIESRSTHTFLADGKVELRFELPPDSQPVLRKRQGKMELLIPVPITHGQTRIVEEILW